MSPGTVYHTHTIHQESQRAAYSSSCVVKSAGVRSSIGFPYREHDILADVLPVTDVTGD